MNITHMKYAVEVEKTRSIKKAADNLYIGQPNLSRAIKELEDSLGAVLFVRTSRGMTPTAQGEEFLSRAKRILHQIDEVEDIFRQRRDETQKFSISVPRASYISHAFAQFAKCIETAKPAEIFYKETNAMRAISNILDEDYNLGIIRYQTIFDKYFKSMLAEKGLVSETITEFAYVLAMSAESPLAMNNEIRLSDLGDYIEVAHADPYVPSLPMADVKKAEFSDNVDKRIFVFERGGQFDLLSAVPTTFMWVSPIPDMLLKQYGLVERQCSDNKKTCKDLLIYRKGYRLSALDNRFITELIAVKRQFL